MTARAGGFYNVFPSQASALLGQHGRSAGSFYTFQTNLPIYKMTAYFTVAPTTETWIGHGSPNTTVPSGRVPISIDHIPLLLP